jgi:hypothetical protein
VGGWAEGGNRPGAAHAWEGKGGKSAGPWGGVGPGKEKRRGKRATGEGKGRGLGRLGWLFFPFPFFFLFFYKLFQIKLNSKEV